jgi:quercetin dioxygenase-like cupin family protein
MLNTGQLNIHSYKNPRSRAVQTVALFTCEELRAELVVLPPGAHITRHSHARQHELFDVIEGAGVFQVGEHTFAGAPGKCVLVPAGTDHSLCNDSSAPWVLRVTYQEQLSPKLFGKLVARALRRTFGLHH